MLKLSQATESSICTTLKWTFSHTKNEAFLVPTVPTEREHHSDFPKWKKKQGKTFLDHTKIQRTDITNKEVWLVCNTINLSWLNNIYFFYFTLPSLLFVCCWGQITATGSILAQAFHLTVGIVIAKNFSPWHFAEFYFRPIWLKDLGSRFMLEKQLFTEQQQTFPL